MNNDNLSILEQLLLKEKEVKSLVTENAQKAIEASVVAEFKQQLKESSHSDEDELEKAVNPTDSSLPINEEEEFEEIPPEESPVTEEPPVETDVEGEDLGTEEPSLDAEPLPEEEEENGEEIIDATATDLDDLKQQLLAAIDEVGPENVVLRFKVEDNTSDALLDQSLEDELPEDELEGDEFEGDELEGDENELPEAEFEEEEENEFKEAKGYKASALKYKKLFEQTEKKLKNLYNLGKVVAKENDGLRETNKVLTEQLEQNKNAMSKATLTLESLGVTNTKLAQIMELWVGHTTTREEKKEMLGDFDSAKTINESKIIYGVWKKRLANSQTKTKGINQIKEEKTFIKESLDIKEPQTPASDMEDAFERYAFYETKK